jgi:hypothetical protein
MRLRRPPAALALLAAGGVVAALILVNKPPSKPSPAGDAPSSSTATVERRDLVATDTEAGTLSYAVPQTVYNRLNGTITWLPRVGETIRPGDVLFRVDGRPVILMDGTTPAFRVLAPGVSPGEDVLQLNRELVALGFDSIAIALDDEWQAATTAGVERLQRSLGETQTGTLAFGQIVFLPGTQLVATVDATLGGDGARSGSGGPSTGTASDLGGGTREYASLKQTAGTPATPAAPGAGTAPATGSPHAAQRRVRSLEVQLAGLAREVDRLRSQRAGGTAGPGKTAGGGSPNATNGSREPEGAVSGSGASSPTPILATTSTRIVVKVALDASKHSEARVGESVTVALPDGQSARGTVTAVSAVAQSSNNNQPAEAGSGGSGAASSTIPVTITLHGHHPAAALDQAHVSVDFVQAVARTVLSVPVTALVAIGGAHYAVQEAAPPRRVIPVRTGLFAAGDVQVSGAGIHPGLEVSDSEG